MLALFEGCATALITPFRNGEIDYPALDRLVETQIAAGIDALVAAGTTGEPATMTWEEHLNVIRRVVEVTNHRVPVIAGISSIDVARSSGVSMVISPNWVRAENISVHTNIRKGTRNLTRPL